MHSLRNITSDLIYVGCDDRRPSCFEGVYSVPDGMAYNSYLLKDEKNVVFDTADKSVTEKFLENVRAALNGGKLNYIVVNHAEPDHTASLAALLRMYPEAEVVCTAKAADIIRQFYGGDICFKTVGENDTLCTGGHTLRFITAPMVHWPEVMVTYDETDKVLFAADAFGSFGALNGALFADEVDFERDFLSEARRYYCNIVGKYGLQVQALLRKASEIDIETICPLHGYVWRKDPDKVIDKYKHWSSYEPEDREVLIAYASVYGNTENAAEIISRLLHERGVRAKMLDVSVKSNDLIIAEAFRCSHIVFAAPTYNGGIFVRMDEVLRDLAVHGIRKRSCAFIENGSWAPIAAKQMQDILSACKEMNVIGTLTVKSSLKEEQYPDAEKLADDIAASVLNG